VTPTALMGPGDIVRDLVRRDMLDPAAVVGGSVEIRDMSRRNQVWLVLPPHSRAYVVKQATCDDTWSGLQREATAYSVLSGHHRCASLRPFLLTLVDIDPARRLLLLASPADAKDLHEHVQSTGRWGVTQAKALGRCLARLHDLPVESLPAEMATDLSNDRPWVLSLHRPSASHVQRMSPGNQDVVRMVQQSRPLCTGLGELQERWTRARLVHGDVRWENCLAIRTAGSARRGLSLIDWELCHVGDPRWDQGCGFAALLSAWAASVTGRPSSRRATTAAAGTVAASGRAFWASSSQSSRVTEPDVDDRVAVVMRFAAARLLQVAVEQTRQFRSVSPTAVALVQLAENAMATPEAVAAHLLGISEPS
jgi:aminoglycoside phosphotransferase (APT) family kinase protein